MREVNERISRSLKRRNSLIREGKDPNLNYTPSPYTWLSDKGYLSRCEHGKRILIHREIYEQNTGEELGINQVHHIDGNKINNDFDNLIACTRSEHMKLHRQLGEIALELYQKGIIKFNKEKKEYYV